MSFVDGFFRFDCHLYDSLSADQPRLQFKLPKHPFESEEQLLGRVVAYLHSYKDGVELTSGPFDHTLPTFWHHDIVGTVFLWGQVGAVEAKKLLKALRAYPQADSRLYIYDHHELRELSDTVPNWKVKSVEQVQLFKIPLEELSALAETLTSSNRWLVTKVDDSLYIEVDGQQQIINFEPLGLDQAMQYARTLKVPAQPSA